MSNYFNYITLKKPKRSVFDLSYENKLSCNMGDLVPVTQYDVIPGDKFKVNSEMVIRFAPLLAPVMHRIDAYVHYFFVPYRLIWDDWKDFITGGEDGTLEPVFPRTLLTVIKSQLGDVTNGTLSDYLGYNLPWNMVIQENYPIQASLLPYRAYQLIYNEFYRDQNLTPEVSFSRSGGIGTSATSNVFTSGTSYTDPSQAIVELIKMRKRAWEKDYFTSCLPTPQRGLEARVPISSESSGTLNVGYQSVNRAYLQDTDIPVENLSDVHSYTSGNFKGRLYRDNPSTGDKDFVSLGNGSGGTHTHSINMSTLAQRIATSFSISQLRTANAVQRFLERMNLGGSRYTEQIYSFFGVKVPDFTLQRPQYLGGGKCPISVQSLPQTSASDISGSVTPQGHLAGNAFASSAAPSFNHTFDEHGLVLGLLSIRPRSAYCNGLDRMMQKFDKYDYYFPQFAHLGEQAVMNSEVMLTGMTAADVGTFGYQERYAEYKFRNSEVHGDFKSSLDYWHLGRVFNINNYPRLNTSFIECNPSDRIYAVEDENTNKVYIQVLNKTTAIRPIPKHVTPSL